MIDYERWITEYIDNSERVGILPAGSQSATEPPKCKYCGAPATMRFRGPDGERKLMFCSMCYMGVPEGFFEKKDSTMIIPAMVGQGDPVRGQPEMTKPEVPGETAAYIAKLEAQVEALKLEEEKTFRVQEDRILALAAKNRELQARIDELEDGDDAGGWSTRSTLPPGAWEAFVRVNRYNAVDRSNTPFPNVASTNWQNATWVDDEDG